MATDTIVQLTQAARLLRAGHAAADFSTLGQPDFLVGSYPDRDLSSFCRACACRALRRFWPNVRAQLQMISQR